MKLPRKVIQVFSVQKILAQHPEQIGWQSIYFSRRSQSFASNNLHISGE